MERKVFYFRLTLRSRDSGFVNLEKGGVAWRRSPGFILAPDPRSLNWSIFVSSRPQTTEAFLAGERPDLGSVLQWANGGNTPVGWQRYDQIPNSLFFTALREGIKLAEAEEGGVLYYLDLAGRYFRLSQLRSVESQPTGLILPEKSFEVVSRRLSNQFNRVVVGQT